MRPQPRLLKQWTQELYLAGEGQGQRARLQLGEDPAGLRPPNEQRVGLIFGQSKEYVISQSLLEKAYVKLHYGYFKIG